jgi:adenylosuccinate synthase
MSYLRQGKLNILLDGQFGSTGKGLFASFISVNDHIDIAISNAGPNAGHTFDLNNGLGKQIAYHLPVSGIICDRSTIYLCSGSIIDPDILFNEIERFNIDPDRLFIDPRAAVIEDCDKEFEKNSRSSVARIASTQKGVGSALSRKILRSSCLAQDHPILKEFVKDLNIDWYLDQGCTALMEVPQGIGLGINSGLSYPHCTSREISVSSALSDIQIHPRYLGNVFMCIRTYPIRVGHLMNKKHKIGDSGPFYCDSKEVTWNDIGVKEELTTNTKRIRRVATFSKLQYSESIKLLKPDFILLNFANYMNEKSLSKLVYELNNISKITHLGFGPTVDDIFEIMGGGVD